jgi:hypothetical protein
MKKKKGHTLDELISFLNATVIFLIGFVLGMGLTAIYGVISQLAVLEQAGVI